jgi:phosphatidylinositol-binding clathrin assembly protein
MSRTDAERALRIYKIFVERTTDVIEYLSEAKALEHAMRLQIPNVKHVLSLLTSLTTGADGIGTSIGGIP